MALNPNYCDLPSMSQWFSWQQALFSFLNTPGLVILSLCLFSFGGWLVFRKRSVRLANITLVLPLLLYLGLISPMGTTLAAKGLTVWLPQEASQKTDAIVILGRGATLRDSRVQEAAQLWQARQAPLIFVSGGIDAPVINQDLQRLGVTPDNIQIENCSRTTEENAQLTAATLQPEGINSIILVTDPTHMLRARLTFQSLGFEVTSHLSDTHTLNFEPPLTLRVIREYVGLVTYGLRGRYFPRALDSTYLSS